MAKSVIDPYQNTLQSSLLPIFWLFAVSLTKVLPKETDFERFLHTFPTKPARGVPRFRLKACPKDHAVFFTALLRNIQPRAEIWWISLQTATLIGNKPPMPIIRLKQLAVGVWQCRSGAGFGFSLLAPPGCCLPISFKTQPPAILLIIRSSWLLELVMFGLI